MATEPPPRALLLGSELAPAPATRIRVVIDDLINLILGPQPATRTPVPRLTASLAPLPSERINSFAFARVRPPLSACLGRIHRRRPRARARVLTRLGLQPREPLLDQLNPRG